MSFHVHTIPFIRMLRSLARLHVIRKHVTFQIAAGMALSSVSNEPSIVATPSLDLVDQPMSIRLLGLKPYQLVTLVANANVDKSEFESRAVYQASETGEVDCTTDTSMAGTFLGKDPMGLFWSLKPTQPNTRFMKKDVTTPFKVKIQVFDGANDQGQVSDPPLTSTAVERLFMAPGTTRIHVNEERVRGTVFIPPGKGPFPAVMDTYGGLASLIETRAALLASHGFVTLALSYIHSTDGVFETSMDYIKGAAEWFCEQDFVDENRLGLLGLCYGGYLFFQLAAQMPQVKAVVNVNGLTFSPFHDEMSVDEIESPWPDPKKVYLTEEGVIIRNGMDSDKPYFIQAWKHGAKILLISGGDDKQVNPKYHQMCYKSVPNEFRNNVQYKHYPGAGHLIEMPYLPSVRSTKPGRNRMMKVGFIPEEFGDEAMMSGGFPQQHAYAQEDSWRRTIQFFKHNLTS